MKSLAQAIGFGSPLLSHWVMTKTTILDFAGKANDPAHAICARYGNKPDALLEILHDLQQQAGHVPEASLPVIAKALNLSRAEVYGVVTFYHDFHQKPHGKHVIKICRAEACQSMGARQLQAMAEKFLNVRMGGTTADHKITLEATYCLGLCASAPAVLVNDRPVARVTSARFEKIVGELA
jgi:formate dehydrogenase subunit gamma